MSFSPDRIQQSIASNKFYPPHINRRQSLQRQWLISDRLPASHSARKILVIEAQAGQGKTTLVYQFLEHCKQSFIWYQIGTEDNDPVLLLSALLLAFSKKIDNFSSPQLAAILEIGQVGPMDLQGCINILLHDIDACLDEELFVIFDDMHLISGSLLTNQLLDYLVDTSPPCLHFIFTSRHPLQLTAEAIRKNPYLIYLDTKDLALDTKDVENLYTTVLDTSISRTEAEKIMEITNGWIMGIVLAAHPLARGNAKNPRISPGKKKNRLINKAKDGYILSYFEDEIFSHLPEYLHATFLKISFLDELDVDLVRVLTDISDIDQHLDRMADENFFVYRLDDEMQVYRFHHLFQEFLQIMARKDFTPEEILDIHRQAANYYLKQALIEKGLKALSLGEDYRQMEQVLQKHGLQLVSKNRTLTILRILQSIPEDILLEHSWLAFFRGLLATDFTPQLTLPFFEACRHKFAENGEEAGELMSLSQIIYFHFVISGRYQEGSAILERTRTLFERTRHSLPSEIFILVARNLAAGYCFFDGNMNLARHYAQIGCDLAITRESQNFVAATRFILGYIGLLSGSRRSSRSEIEKSYILASDPLVGMSNRLTLHIMQLCELSMHGDFVGFLHHKGLIQERVDQTVVRQTVAAPYLYVWSCIALIAAGKAAEAIEVIDQGLHVSKTAATGHMTSQFLQWRAFAHGILGNKNQAKQDIETSFALRTDAGGPFYIAYNLAIKGATMAILDQEDDARASLYEGLRIAETIPSPYISACCRAYLASLDVDKENKSSTTQNLSAWLRLMKENDYKYFWGFEPKSIIRLLCTAVKLGIETKFARTLARERFCLAISDDGKDFPILAIKVLGKFSIGIGSRELFGPHDLSAHQRELIGLLISSPEQRISQEQVQLVFWPDSPPDKARKALDTLVTRLRKTLSQELPVSAKTYLILDKGYLQLNHTSIDAVCFLHSARKGLKLGSQGFWWQAGNAFIRALSNWSHFSLVETFSYDQAASFNDEVQDTMKDMCLAWSGRLVQNNRLNEALDLLEKTDKVLALDEDCVVLRHQIFLKKHNPLKARDVLKSYQQELLRLGYTDEEAEEIVTGLTQLPASH